MTSCSRLLGLALAVVLAGCSADEDASGGEGDQGGPQPNDADGTGTGSGDYEQPKKASKSSDEPPEARAPSGAVCASVESKLYWLSSDDSNSMASAARARELLRLGKAPPPTEIRAYEFLNYYNVLLPETGDGVSIDMELASGPAGLYDLLLTVQAAPMASPRGRSITFVVDTSGSMTGDSLARAQAAMRAVAGRLGKGDQVSIAIWNDLAPLLDGLEVSGPDDAAMLAAIDGLQPNGGSDLTAGLTLGYQLATAWHRRDGLNRLVLVSDGGATTTEIDRDAIQLYAEDAEDRGIYLVGVGTGPADGYDDELMDYVTEAGRGAYVYLDGTDEAKRVFGDRFDEVMEVAARDVQLELSLPELFRIREFFGEGYSEDASQIEPQHLAPGDAMSFFQTMSSSCSAGTLPLSATIRMKATWRDPATLEPREALLEKSLEELLKATSTPALDKAAAVAAYAYALASVDQPRLHAAHQAATEALQSNPDDPDLLEITELVELHPAY